MGYSEQTVNCKFHTFLLYNTFLSNLLIFICKLNLLFAAYFAPHYAIVTKYSWLCNFAGCYWMFNSKHCIRNKVSIEMWHTYPKYTINPLLIALLFFCVHLNSKRKSLCYVNTSRVTFLYSFCTMYIFWKNSFFVSFSVHCNNYFIDK